MLRRDEYEEILGCPISDDKWIEILNLEQTTVAARGKDLTGKKIYHLLVLFRGPNYRSPSGHTQGQWWCICDCSEQNILLVRGSNLSSENTKSCGCHNNELRK